ncbi:hypothetical protein GCM10022420_006150 [Streptomyces iranensis]
MPRSSPFVSIDGLASPQEDHTPATRISSATSVIATFFASNRNPYALSPARRVRLRLVTPVEAMAAILAIPGPPVNLPPNKRANGVFQELYVPCARSSPSAMSVSTASAARSTK